MFEAGPGQPPERRCPNCNAIAGPTARYCSGCGRFLGAPQGTAAPRFCTQCGAPLDSQDRFCTRCGAPVGPGVPVLEAAASNYPLRYDVEYPEKLSRLLIFVKWLLAIPHFIIVWALGYAIAAVTVVAFFAILFTRRYPRGLFNLVVGASRWGANVTAYTYLFRDEYPPFSMDPGRYPVRYEVDYPEKLSRWLIFVKWLLVIPHQIVLSLLSIIGFLFGFLAFFGILFTGRYPRTFFDFNVGLQRWGLRVGAYSALLRDEFPPYSMLRDAGPGSRRAIILSAIFGVLGALAIAALYAFLIFASTTRDTQTVGVSYSGLQDGIAAREVDLDGVAVTLYAAEDPYEAFGDDAGPGQRLIAFDLDISNEDALWAFIDETAFEMEDTAGDDHSPEEVFTDRSIEDLVLTDNERVDITVVFSLDEDEDPANLWYSPSGPLTFWPLGEDVRFEFR